MTKEEAIKIFNTMLLIIKAVEQKISLGSVDEVVEAVKMAISSLSAEQTAEYFTFEELESWLFENALNNLGNVYGESVEELISRLDGFKEFVKDRRVEQAEINHNSTENNDNDLVSRKAVLESMKTYTKFACLPNGKLEPFHNLDNAEDYVPYVHLEDMLKCVESLPTCSAEQTDSSVIAKIKMWSELPEYSEGERNVMKVILQELEDTIPQTDSVPKGVFDQVKWERDIAIEQLKDLGYGLGEKPRKQTDSVLEDIKAEIPKMSHWESADGQDLVMVADVIELINKHISRKENE